MSSNWEHFRHAAAVLVGPGPVKQRLADAFVGHLRAVDLDSLPADVLPRFRELSTALQSSPPTCGLNAVVATVRKMSEQEAGQRAAQVLELLVALAGSDNREPVAGARQLRLVSGEDDEIPAFLNRA